MTFIAASPYTLALQLHARGVAEIPGPRTNALIAAMNAGAGAGANEDAPWCASFVHFCHWILGYECPAENPAGARSWLTCGAVRDVAKAMAGDVVILWRESRDSYKGHVGFFYGWDRDGNPILLCGNTSDEVKFATYPRDRILGVRVPASQWDFKRLLSKVPAQFQTAAREI